MQPCQRRRKLDLYLGDSDLNNLYYFADAVANRALLDEINPNDHAAAMEQLRLETTRVHAFTVISAVMALIIKKYLGQTLDELGASETEIFPRFNSAQVKIPFFVELVKDEAAQPALPADAASPRG